MRWLTITAELVDLIFVLFFYDPNTFEYEFGRV